MTSPLVPPKVQFFDDNGNPLSGGKVFSFVSGTSTPKATYTSSTGLVANANPVILDSAGRANIWLTGSYRIQLKTAADVQIYQVDGVTDFGTGGATPTTSLVGSASEAYFLTASGAVNTMTGTTGISLIAYNDNLEIALRPNNDNTGATTLNIDGLGAKSIRTLNGALLVGGEFKSGLIHLLRYNQNAGYFVLLTSAKIAAAATTDVGMSRVRGLRGTQVTLSTAKFIASNGVVLRSDSLATTVFQPNSSEITVNIGTAGPAVNGRDQAAAFSSNSWLNIFFIWGSGQALATIASADTGSLTGQINPPTLPANYTHYAYICSVAMSGANLQTFTVKGGTVFFRSSLLTTSVAASQSANISGLGSYVPRCSPRFTVNVSISSPADAGTPGNDVLVIYPKNTQGGQGVAANARSFSGGSGLITNASYSELSHEITAGGVQELSYAFTRNTVGGSNSSISLFVESYSVPNGDV